MLLVYEGEHVEIEEFIVIGLDQGAHRHFSLLFALVEGKLRVLIANEGVDVVDDFGDGVVVLHHFLVVAAALVWSPGFNNSADLKIDFDDPAHHVVRFEQGCVLFQELLVLDVLLERPCPDIEHFLLLFQLIQPLSSLEKTDWNLSHLIGAFTLL